MLEYPGEESTVKEAQDYVKEYAEDGVYCPCCERLVKLYKRKLHSEMAAFLFRLVFAYKTHPRWYSTRELVPGTSKSTTDGSYLVHWDLVQKEPAKNNSGGKAGSYKPTQRGIDFVMGEVVVPSHIHMLCGELVGYSDDYVTFAECIENKFDYDELMKGMRGEE